MIPELSIVIPAWILDQEKETFIRSCVGSVKRWTDVPYELIVIDNGSVFAKDYMRSEADICVANRENLGFAKALNQGFKLARGRHVCMMNDDIVVGPSWASRMCRVSETGAVVMPALIDVSWKEEGESFEECIDRVQREKHWKSSYSDVELFPELDGWGSLFMARKDVFDRSVAKWGDFMSEDYRYTMFDDRDLWLRLCLLGIRNVRTHEAWVHHVGNGTWGKIPENEGIYLANKAIYEKKLNELWKKGA